MTHTPSPGTTSVPLRFFGKPFLGGTVSEGPACQVRFPITDNPLPFCGHDERAPPNDYSEGPARQVRLSALDEPPQFARVSVRRLKFDHPLPFGGD
ncbi:hypothetical protein THTE_0481 [Thermogutta terrifontis]|uniref:Uncharacterized protein n=1 Tax=Thermogutta terrifontis TaxID=1331910 RepID=A0A286RAV2_9BACT|nr:hypothetical protein THTE_0481 [Thermogutta terrifontis]